MRRTLGVATSIGFLLATLACVNDSSSGARPQADESIPITYGGFVQNGPPDELLDGQCSPNVTRDILECDIHNGLLHWNITEVTLQVISNVEHVNENTPAHYYRQSISIPCLQTATVTIRLGMTLPPDTQIKVRGRPSGSPLSHWSWLVVGARGRRVQ